ncbi:MAG: HEPN domain-containing protein [Verrucomicrobia bacterium]|nr:MAG: HEPN domain-containing protein [Verrucomicrobiota bacterium]
MKGNPQNPSDWYKIADLDLRRATKALAENDLSACCLWLQQAAEKALKGWLIGHNWQLIKTHDLERMIHEAAGYGQDLTWCIPTAVHLRQLYFTERYVDDSPDPEPDYPQCHAMHQDIQRLLATLNPTILP